MAELAPTLEEWRKLYRAATRMKELAPWEWMGETAVFGVEDPETGDLGFVSVMGMSGEHRALAVYLGPEGLYGFWALVHMADSIPPEAVLIVPHLQASFENRDELTRDDRDVIKQLELRFRGRQAWPMFRSWRPGYLPWYLEAWEARFLTCALEQTAEVALRFKEDPLLLEPPDEERYLVRVPQKENEVLEWIDRVVTVPVPDPEPIPVAVDPDLLEEVKRLPGSPQTVEMDLFVIPARIEERGTRPYLPHMLLVVDGATGLPLGMELLKPERSPEAMWGLVPVRLMSQLARMGCVPGGIRVRSPVLFELLQPLAKELETEVKRTPVLRRLDEARATLLERLT